MCNPVKSVIIIALGYNHARIYIYSIFTSAGIIIIYKLVTDANTEHRLKQMHPAIAICKAVYAYRIDRLIIKHQLIMIIDSFLNYDIYIFQSLKKKISAIYITGGGA